MKGNWREVIISPQTSLKDAICVIDNAALQIALVTDTSEKLIGVITDGDIRRALIRGISLEMPVFEVMNDKPKTALADDSKIKLLAIMDKFKLIHLPVLDKKGKVVGLETLQDLHKSSYFPNPVFILAGGFGVRLKPLTNLRPKPLLEVGGKPILETIIDNFTQAGFKDFYIAVHYLADQIKDYFSDGQRWGINIHYIEESQPLGTAGSLSLLPKDLPNLPIIVMNGDILTQVDFSRLLTHHQQQQSVATLCVHQYEYQIPYGVVSIDDQRVTGIVEKPIKSCFSNAGIYVLDPFLVQSVKKNQQIDMPQLLNQQIAAGKLVSMFPIYEYWLDIGKESDFLRAQGEFGKYF